MGVAEAAFDIYFAVYNLFAQPWIDRGSPGGQLRNIGHPDPKFAGDSYFLNWKYDRGSIL